MGLPAGYPLVHSALAAPIASLTVVYGWVCLLNKLGADAFDEDDKRILTSLASQVGRIYETGSLYAELQRNTELLRESELRFRQLAESIDTVFFLVDPEANRTLYVSPAYEEIWGRSIESVYASTTAWTDSIVPEDRDRALAERYRNGNTAGFETEFRIARPDGGVRWIRSRGFPIRNAEGRVYRIAGVAEDITQQVHLERVLRESEAAMRRGDVIAKLAHIITRPDGSFQSWSDTLPQLIGREPAQVPASTRAWLNIVHPEDRDRFRAASIEAGVKGVRRELDYRLRRGNGEIMHVRQVYDPIRDASKEQGPCRWFNTLQDITDQKNAEEELRESERRFSDMLANVQLVSLMLDAQAKILYCNDYLLTLTGWRREEILGRDWFGLFIPAENRDVEEIFGGLLRDDPASRHHENVILTRSGKRRLVAWNNSVLRSPNGEVIGTASIGEDITERKSAEDEVRRLNANLERLVHERTAELQFANRELETFSYSVSHDLRAPLHAMQGYAQALKESPTAQLSGQDRHYLDRISSGGVSMDLLIDDLLSLARISKADLIATEVDLSVIATEVLSALRAAEPARRTSIKVHPRMVAHGDAGLLRIALTNLLGNAWKFSAGREVTVIEVGQLDDRLDIATFFVQDQGAGFDPAYSKKLFGTFQRLHTQTEFPGTGIGLATVQRVIERHGGSVWAEGAVGQGATFYFALPQRADTSLPRAA
jgi:PAS domain S-box-containing protein